MWPFSKASFLDVEDEQWQAETWRCFLRHCGGIADLRRSPLVTPTKQFFPPSDAAGHARASYIFDFVKRHARMQDWTCELAAQPQRPQMHVGELAVLKPVKGGLPLGTFRVEGNNAVITYDPASLDNPPQLIATLAHELAHYRMMTFRHDLPGGEELHEFATDMMTVYMGFGIFGTSLAFNFRQYQGGGIQGWSASRQGYLSERAWVFALAGFLELRQQSSADAQPYLKPHLFALLRKARSYIAKRDLLGGIEEPPTTARL